MPIVAKQRVSTVLPFNLSTLCGMGCSTSTLYVLVVDTRRRTDFRGPKVLSIWHFVGVISNHLMEPLGSSKILCSRDDFDFTSPNIDSNQSHSLASVGSVSTTRSCGLVPICSLRLSDIAADVRLLLGVLRSMLMILNLLALEGFSLELP